MVIFVTGFAVVLVLAFYIAVRRLLAGEVFGGFGGLPRNADLLARVEALTAMEWAVRTQRPLSQALWSIIPEVSRRQQLRLRRVAAAMEEGATLGTACARAPRIFPAPLRLVMSSAQALGALERVLPAMAERGRAERASLTWAMACFVLPLGAAFVALATLGRTPGRLRDIAVSQGTEAPVVDLAEFVTRAAVAWPVAVIAVLWLLAVARRWHTGRRLQRWCAQWLPGVRGVAQARWLADVGDLTGALIEAGVPANQALAVAQGLEATAAQRARLQAAAVALGEGVPVGEALHAQLPRWARWRMHLLSASGDPAAAFRAVAAEASRRASAGVRRLAALIYPVTTVLLALAVALWLRHLSVLSIAAGDRLLVSEGLLP